MSYTPVYIGPCACRIRSPKHRWTSNSNAHGIRSASIGGVVQWTQAQQLSELVDNPERRQSYGEASGVPEEIWFGDDALLSLFSGRYLLDSFDIEADHQWSGHGIDYPVAFSLTAHYLGGNHEVVVVSSSRQLVNDFGISGTPTTAAAFLDEFAPDYMLVTRETDGGIIVREYDPDPYVPGLKTEPFAVPSIPGTGPFILMETSGHLLTEGGDALLLEA